MRKIKRIIAVTICLTLFVLMAMGSGSSTEETKIVTSVSTNTDETTTEGVTVEETSAPDIVTIEEQELVNEDGIIIKALEYVDTGLMGEGIKLLITNSTDKNITVGCTALIVNNYMISDLFGSSVAAGMNANETLYLSSNELEAAGIESVGQIEIYFHIFDSDTWEDIYNSECITIRTSDYDNMDITPNDGGFELYNEDGIRIVGKTVDENSFWGTAILLYIENNSGRNIGITVQNMSINSFMMNPVFSCTVYNERMAIDDITIFSSDLEDNGIEEIQDVSLSFHIYDVDSWATIVDTDAISFQAS